MTLLMNLHAYLRHVLRKAQPAGGNAESGSGENTRIVGQRAILHHGMRMTSYPFSPCRPPRVVGMASQPQQSNRHPVGTPIAYQRHVA